LTGADRASTSFTVVRSPDAEPPESLVWPLLILGAMAAVLLLGYLVRSRLGMELSPAGVQAAVTRLGWYAPLVFFGLVMFRQFLVIPSWLILPAGGLCFGTVLGTALGGAALAVSGCMKFALARWAGRTWVREHLGNRFDRFERHVDRLGPLVIGLSTAHPLGVLAPFHWGAGLSSIRFAPFALAIVLGAPVRAFAFSALGATIVDPSTPEFRAVCLGLGAVVLLPLAIPAVRRRLWGRP
jgi:uncharacterized membrane protein YdjX (TVP38/TMEM64 family)